MKYLHDVEAEFRAMLPSEVLVAAAEPRLCDDELYPDEFECVKSAVPQRRAEFATARVLARGLLNRLGLAPISLAPHEDRTPRWPRGLVGSISHTRRMCAVVVCPDSVAHGVGIDIEDINGISIGMADLICAPQERAALDALPDALKRERLALLFSAKEALFKAIYPMLRPMPTFSDVCLEVDTFDLGISVKQFETNTLTLSANVVSRRHIAGWYRLADGSVLTAFVATRRAKVTAASPSLTDRRP